MGRSLNRPIIKGRGDKKASGYFKILFGGITGDGLLGEKDDQLEKKDRGTSNQRKEAKLGFGLQQ